MELNREQIIKALECCKNPRLSKCYGCPREEEDNLCMYRLYEDSLALINELTEENERLQKALNTDISIVRVSRGSSKTAHLREVGRIKVDAIKADTVRKMQDAVAVHFGTYTDTDTVKVSDVFRLLGKIAEEMLEGNNDK